MSTALLIADFVMSGEILGSSLETSPSEWDQALGGSDWPLVDTKRGRMRRDYGLVEVSYTRDGDAWRCDVVNLQVRRIDVEDQSDVVPPGLAETYGPLERNVSWKDVEGLLHARGGSAELLADTSHEFARRSASRTGVLVVTSGTDDNSRVWSVGLARDAESWRRPQ